MFERSQNDRIDRWYREAAKGKARFILLRGVVCWGLPMFIIVTFLFPAIAGSAGASHSISSLLRGLVVWGGSGAFFGWWLWFFAVKKHGLTRESGGNDVVEER